jgi:hypothetical protein
MHKALLFFCSILCHLASAQRYQVRRSDLWTIQHENCKVEQGDNMSFIDCPNTFEIFKTDSLADNPYENELYGEVSSAVTFVHTTLETKNRQRITWLFGTNEVYSAEEMPDGSINKVKIMTLDLDEQQVVDGLWVFDAYVVVRTTNKRFLFFEKPLLAGETEQPMTQILNEFRTSEVSFISEEFGRNEQNQTQAFLYGVAEGMLYRYVFDIDLETQVVEISSLITQEVPNL